MKNYEALVMRGGVMKLARAKADSLASALDKMASHGLQIVEIWQMVGV